MSLNSRLIIRPFALPGSNECLSQVEPRLAIVVHYASSIPRAYGWSGRQGAGISKSLTLF